MAPRGIKTIELSEDKAKLRLILVVVLIVIALTAFGVGVNSWLTREKGWYTVTANADYKNCANELLFTYYVGSTEKNTTQEYKDVTALYSDLTVNAYREFNRYEDFVGVNNVYTINKNPNKPIKVSKTLYDALKLITENDNRYLFLGAIHDEYTSLFLGVSDSPIMENNDPYINDTTKSYFETLVKFASDPEKVSLEFLDDNNVKLNVSDDYLSFANENGITTYIDFFKTKNAFIVDYICSSLIENGYKKGSISSYDGFARCMDDSGESFAINLFSKNDNVLFNAVTFQYNTSMSIISLRAYPLSALDDYDFMTKSDGSIIPPYVDITDGLYKTATNDLMLYSESSTLSEMVVKALDAFVASELDESLLSSYADDGIYSVWFEKNKIITNGSSSYLVAPYKDGDVEFVIEER